MAIILPEGTVDAWQAAHVAGTAGTWNDLGQALLLHADVERDPALRDDLITLARLAGARAQSAIRRRQIAPETH